MLHCSTVLRVFGPGTVPTRSRQRPEPLPVSVLWITFWSENNKKKTALKQRTTATSIESAAPEGPAVCSSWTDMSSSAQRKRRPVESPLVSRPSTKTSRAAQSRSSSRRTHAGADPPAETIDVVDNTDDGVEEVVDLTCEGAEAAVVDLTNNNDSVLLVDEDPQSSRVPAGESYVLSSDEDEDLPPFSSAAAPAAAHASRSTPGLISCPVCLDLYSEIVGSGRLVVSTKCGHVFCSQCLRDALTSSHTCPTCRKRLTSRQYHPLYV